MPTSDSFNHDHTDVEVSGPVLRQMDVELVLIKEHAVEPRVINHPGDTHALVEDVFSLSTKAREHFGALYLDAKRRVIAVHILHIGALNSTTSSSRDVAQAALLHNASAVILFHNHPSGDAEPSPEDVEFTLKLKLALIPLEIKVLDHIVIGRGDTPYASIGHIIQESGDGYAPYINRVLEGMLRYL